MSKEYLGAFGRITSHTEYDNDGSYDCLQFEDDCKLVDDALERLEQIDKADPSVALELVGYLKDHHLNAIPYYDWLNDIEKYILKAQIEHKTLKTIKEKCVDVFRISYYIRTNRISELEWYKEDRNLTDEELELLKEVLE